ncbi:MAG: competence protein CoiA family protein [Pseudomonadota bacterium]
MLIALVDGERRLAGKFAHRSHRCCCPGCKRPVQARVGDERVAHWAHWKRADCLVAAGETPWHREWKSLGRPEEIEVVRPKWPSNRADLCLMENDQQQVVELQHSGITRDAILQREQAYGDVVWIVDVSGRAFTMEHDRYHWKRASQVWTYAEQVLLDDGKTVHGRLAGACRTDHLPGELLFKYMNSTGGVVTLPRPTDRSELLALLAAFKAARHNYSAAREAERIAYEQRLKEEKELEDAARRDSWFTSSPAPQLSEDEQVRADLRRISAALDAMRAPAPSKPVSPTAVELEHDILFGEWPAPRAR